MIDTTPAATLVNARIKRGIPSCREFNSAFSGTTLFGMSAAGGTLGAEKRKAS